MELPLAGAVAAEGTEGAEGTVETLRVERLPCLTEDGVRDAVAAADPEKGTAIVIARLTGNGRERFARVTRENVGRPLAIVVEGKVVSAPVIRPAIEGGEAVISGAFRKEEAGRISDRRNAYRTNTRAYLEALRRGRVPGKE